MIRLVYLSPLPWGSFAQRAHRFVEWFHRRTGGTVMWIEPYPTRLPEAADLRRPRKLGLPEMSVQDHPGWVILRRPRSLPIEPLPGARLVHAGIWKGLLQEAERFLAPARERFVVVGKPSDLALALVERCADAHAVYDAMDDFPAFYRGLSKASMRRREARLAEGVDRILVSSSELQRRFARLSSKVVRVLNACDTDSLPVVAPAAPAAVPVVGYVGTIARWFDWPLVFEMARVRPSLHFRLIGPVYAPPPRPLPANVELLPACSHPAAIEAMAGFSAGLIPFLDSELTASVDPIKYYEYAALGLPVLTTAFGEMTARQGQPGVWQVGGGADLGAALDAAVAYRADPAGVTAFRVSNSWDARFDAAGLFRPLSGHGPGERRGVFADAAGRVALAEAGPGGAGI